jgi:hypothetical protein
VDAVGGGGPGLERDDAAVRAAEARRVAARVQLDLLEHLGVEHAGPAEEVEQQRHLVTVDVDRAVVGVRAADEQEAQPERRARDAGQGLDDAHRIAERAGHAGQLLPLDRAAGDLEVVALALDHRRVDRAAARPHPQPDLDPLVGGDRHRALEPIEAIGDDQHGVRAGRDAVEREAAGLVGDRVEPELLDADDRAGHHRAGAALDDLALEGDRQPEVAAVAGRPLGGRVADGAGIRRWRRRRRGA